MMIKDDPIDSIRPVPLHRGADFFIERRHTGLLAALGNRGGFAVSGVQHSLV